MTKTDITAVLDTSSLWSSQLRFELVDAAMAEWYTAVWSDWIIGETYRILAVKWIDRRGADASSIRRMSAAANLMMRAMGPTLSLVRALPDTRHFPPTDSDGRSRHGGVVYLGPAEFLSLIHWPLT